jgi:preprotein translocase subunit SecF
MHWPLIRLLPKETHFKFVRWAPVAAGLSGLAVLAAIVSLAVVGLNLSTDFKGGNEIQVTTNGPAPIAQLRAALNAMALKDTDVHEFGSPSSAVLRFEPTGGGDPALAEGKIKAALIAQFPGLTVTGESAVGPKISGELFTKGMLALGVAIALMLVYIWFRFQLQFGFGAVVALAHDIVLTMGMMSIFHLEFSMPSIAALLTVIGYSMNEKVISFDRLRENLRKYKKMPLAEVINLSENERLSRTMITGATALLALSGMLFLGGPTIYPTIIAMVFGIFVGTYSSIYVALPVILIWGVNRNDAEAAKPVAARP